MKKAILILLLAITPLARAADDLMYMVIGCGPAVYNDEAKMTKIKTVLCDFWGGNTNVAADVEKYGRPRQSWPGL